ncbi:MAG: acyl carrier protein [Candidatus Omnitrophota bacterium]
MISDRLKKIILNQLKLNNFDLTEKTQAYQVPGWDSLNHAIMLAAIEKEFDIHFNIAEVLRLMNLGDLQNLVNSKTANKSEL